MQPPFEKISSTVDVVEYDLCIVVVNMVVVIVSDSEFNKVANVVGLDWILVSSYKI